MKTWSVSVGKSLDVMWPQLPPMVPVTSEMSCLKVMSMRIAFESILSAYPLLLSAILFNRSKETRIGVP